MNYQNPMLPTQKQLDHWKLEYLDDAIGFNDAMVQSFQLGANLQLEQVIKWIKANPIEEYVYTDDYHSGAIVKEKEFLKDLKQAMRPQQQQEKS